MNTTCILMAAALLAVTGRAAAAEAEEPATSLNKIAFDTYSGYFVSNRFEADAPTSFVVIRDQAAFDQVFGVAMTMRDKSHRLAPDAFDKNLVVTAIHRGKAMVTYQVDEVGVSGHTLVLRYRTKEEPSPSAEFACPLILTVPKDPYDAVRFVENGREIKTLAVAQPAAFEVTSREPGTVTAAVDNDRLVISIRGGKGIGKATVRRPDAKWPAQVVVRVYLGGLESLKLGAGDKILTASVQSHGDRRAMLTFAQAGAKGEEVKQDSPYQTVVLTKDAGGADAPAPPPKGGWFEIAVPKALLTGSAELNLDWIDFYR